MKEHVQNGAQKDKIIIKYERQQCYGAEDISKAETGKMNVRQGQLQKLLQLPVNRHHLHMYLPHHQYLLAVGHVQQQVL